MNMIITGFPGVGKGTQAEKICSKYNIEHLSTGNLFRSEIAAKTSLGKELDGYIKNGNLVPDKLTIKIFKNELKKSKYINGFLLDGFPRTVNQAKSFINLIREENISLDNIIDLSLEEEVIIKRIVNRLVCSSCGNSFHKLYVKPINSGVCDSCGGDLVQREDDKLEAITNRLFIAREQTLPVIEYFKELNLLETVILKETDTTEEVFSKIVTLIEK